MKIKSTVVTLLLVLSLGLGVFQGSVSDAAGANRKAGKAFATAVSKGKISIKGEVSYSIGDMDGDGVKDLLIDNGSAATVFAYKSGKVKKILKYLPEYSLVYDNSKKVFWECGEGDGSWRIALKLDGGSLVEQYRYYSEYDADSQIKFYYKKADKDAEEITEDAYSEIGSQIVKYEKTINKAKLIKKLKKLS